MVVSLGSVPGFGLRMGKVAGAGALSEDAPGPGP